MSRRLVAIAVQTVFLLLAHDSASGSDAGNSQDDIRRKVICDMLGKAVAVANEMGFSKEETAALFAHVTSTAEYASPALNLSCVSIDLGEISSTQVSYAMVDIENVSRSTVKLKARTSCGCTQCRIEDEELPAGKKTTMKVTFNPTERSGQEEVIEQIALVYSQSGADRKMLIPVRAKIRQYFKVTPSKIDFGDLYSDSGYSALIDIECSDLEWGREVTVKAPIGFSAFVARSQSEPWKSVRVEVKANEHCASGKYVGNIIATTELRGHSNEIRVPIYGRLWDTGIRCEPATAEVGFIGPNETRNLVCTLISFDESPYIIENVSTDLGDVTWRLRDGSAKTGPERSQCVQLELKAKAQKQRIIRGSVWFDIRHGEKRERVSLEVRGYYYEAPSRG